MNNNQSMASSSSPQAGKRKGGPKYYVVWDGESQGIFTSWEACQEAVIGVPGAKYKAFKSLAEAEDAFNMGYDAWKAEAAAANANASDTAAANASASDAAVSSAAGSDSHASKPSGTAAEAAAKSNSQGEAKSPQPAAFSLPPGAIREAIAVDAACSKNPGPMEYRGVYLGNGRQLFHYGPVQGTNNIGEFLAIVHGLAFLKQNNQPTMPIYSDSVNAQLWVRKKRCKTTLERNAETEQLYQLIERAEKWLRENTYANPIIKWPTDQWGEIPADFGRK